MGQNQPVDQVTAAALLKYGQKCTVPIFRFWSDFDKYFPSDQRQMQN